MTVLQRYSIVAYLADDKTMDWIAEKLQCDARSVLRWTRRFFEDGNLFSSTGVCKLRYYEKMTGGEMIRIIDDTIRPEAERLFPSGRWEVLHDNDKKWRCNNVQRHRHNKGVTQINDDIWPSYSPDLNPIENLFGTLSSRVFDRNPCGVDELKAFLEDEVSKVDAAELRKLAHSMKTRAQMVIDANGARIPY